MLRLLQGLWVAMKISIVSILISMPLGILVGALMTVKNRFVKAIFRVYLPTVAIGIYLRVLYALQLDDDILWLAKEDKLGKALQDLSLKTRERASKKE